MSARVEAGRVVKTLASPADAARLLARTAALRQQGVRTPAAAAGDRPGEVVFERIDGPAGLASIVDQGANALEPILAALAVLHDADSAGAPVFDPEAKIRPRLSATQPRWIAETLRVSRTVIDAPAPAGLVHGDFHAGQVVLDRSGQVWLLDLDDLAKGPCEADLGNFAAHLATRPETRERSCRQGFETWLASVLAAYPGTANPRLARAHGAVALVRRALKLAEAGDRSVLDELSRGILRV